MIFAIYDALPFVWQVIVFVPLIALWVKLIDFIYDSWEPEP